MRQGKSISSRIEALMANPNQYFLLADHIKLSLLERQRAISLKLEPTAQDGNIARSLESLREGLEDVTKERIRLQEAGETSYVQPLTAQAGTNQHLEHHLPSKKQNTTSEPNTTIYPHNFKAPLQYSLQPSPTPTIPPSHQTLHEPPKGLG